MGSTLWEVDGDWFCLVRSITPQSETGPTSTFGLAWDDNTISRAWLQNGLSVLTNDTGSDSHGQSLMKM